MRCRKARSYLSAYSNGELIGRDAVAVREHLSICAACRKEEALLVSIHDGARRLAGPALSADFNTKLLNRIAHERFSETRTRSYVPRRAPLLMWRQVIPAFVATLAVVLVAVTFFKPGHFSEPAGLASISDNGGLDDSYLTARPEHNPNMTRTVNVQKDWSLSAQLAHSERANRISGQLSGSSGFGSLVAYPSQMEMPQSGILFFKVRPIVRVYQTAAPTRVQEDQKVY